MATTPTRTSTATSARRGNGGAVPRGIDAPAERPGVPMESATADTGAHWEAPERQAGSDDRLHRASLDRPTPVFGTAQPPRGVSGMLRRRAYQIPEHFARHWALLMLADRVDVLEDRLGSAVAEPLDRLGVHAGARYARKNPMGMIAGLVVGGWLARKVL